MSSYQPSVTLGRKLGRIADYNLLCRGCERNRTGLRPVNNEATAAEAPGAIHALETVLIADRPYKRGVPGCSGFRPQDEARCAIGLALSVIAVDADGLIVHD